MNIQNFPACCAAYNVCNLEYFNPLNSWYKRVRPQLVKEGVVPSNSKVNDGFMSSRFNNNNNSQYSVQWRTDVFNQTVSQIKAGDKSRDWFQYLKTAAFVGHSNTPPTAMQYYLAGKISRFGQNKRSLLSKATGREELNDFFTDGVHENMQEELSFYYMNGYMLYAITSTKQQPNCEVALERMGFNIIANIASRNSTQLKTWFINTHGMKQNVLNRTLGEHRASQGFQTGEQAAFQKWSTMMHEWDTALHMNSNPEQYDDEGSYIYPDMEDNEEPFNEFDDEF